MTPRQTIDSGKAILGIEFGSTRIKAVLIDEENKNNDYLTVKNCLLEGGKYGVYMGGTSTVALPKEIGGVIEGNTYFYFSLRAGDTDGSIVRASAAKNLIAPLLSIGDEVTVRYRDEEVAQYWIDAYDISAE